MTTAAVLVVLAGIPDAAKADPPSADLDLDAFAGAVWPRTEHVHARTEVWGGRGAAVERLGFEMEGPRVRADGAPLPLTPGEEATVEPGRYRFHYSRGWRAPAVNAGRLSLSVTPHFGVGIGSDGLTPRAGARIDIGERLSGLAPEGHQRFGDQGRWYLFAAGDGRSVGYNFMRSREGDLIRSGLSQDRGSYMGDAQAGVAWRRGDLQASFGYVYRKHKVRELRPAQGLDRSASEGMVAFQLSIRPDW